MNPGRPIDTLRVPRRDASRLDRWRVFKDQHGWVAQPVKRGVWASVTAGHRFRRFTTWAAAFQYAHGRIYAR